jgi:hypothetical protein
MYGTGLTLGRQGEAVAIAPFCDLSIHKGTDRELAFRVDVDSLDEEGTL